jgi:hypothetical protein
MELTKEHFDRQLSRLATADELQALSKKIDSLQTSLDQHTASLDGIARDVKDWNTELIAVRARLDRHDQWFKQISDHLGVTLSNN